MPCLEGDMFEMVTTHGAYTEPEAFALIQDRSVVDTFSAPPAHSPSAAERGLLSRLAKSRL